MPGLCVGGGATLGRCAGGGATLGLCAGGIGFLSPSCVGLLSYQPGGGGAAWASYIPPAKGTHSAIETITSRILRFISFVMFMLSHSSYKNTYVYSKKEIHHLLPVLPFLLLFHCLKRLLPDSKSALLYWLSYRTPQILSAFALTGCWPFCL